MARFHVIQTHNLSTEQCKVRIADLFEAYRDKYGIRSRWSGDVLHLTGSGFDGEARLTDQRVEVDVKLGFTIALFRTQVESTLRKELEARLSAPNDPIRSR